MEDAYEEGNKDATEVAPALISVHPSQNSVALAIGSDLRVFNLTGGCAVSLVDDSVGSPHKDSIRAVRYGANGKLFVSAGDDKLVKIWLAVSWRCITTVCSEKKVTAVAISNDGFYVCFADKFGVVWVVNVDLEGLDGNQMSANKKAAPMLSHYCSILTSLEFSPDGRFLISADRDSKIRVNVFPKKPLDGAHEIQSYALGHTEFVSCLAFVCTQEFPQGFLVSGSGDSTVRLWEISSGSLLDTCDIIEKAGPFEFKGIEQESRAAVTDLCSIPDSTLVAVAVQSFQGIILLRCDLSAQTLSVAKVVTIKGDAFIPISLATTVSSGLLWMVTGASNMGGVESPSLARVKIISDCKETSAETVQKEPIVLEDDETPGGVKLLEKLQGRLSIDEKVFSAAAEALKVSISKLLKKKQYSTERQEFRKRGRNDKKLK